MLYLVYDFNNKQWLGSAGGARSLVTLCDPLWQVTSRSSQMGFPERAILAFTLYRPF